MRGHSGVEGNERADELVKVGSEALVCGPVPFLPIYLPACTKALNELVEMVVEKRRECEEGYVGVFTRSAFFLGLKRNGPGLC